MALVDRRQQIVEAATKSFALFGYKATTMDQVAKIANVGKGTIYTFFKNKEELFDEIMRMVIVEMRRITEQAALVERTFFDNLFVILGSLLEFRREHDLLVKLSQEVRDVGTPEAKEGMEKIEAVILDYLERQVHHAIEQGEITEVDPEVVAFVMLKLFLALTSDWNKRHEPLNKEQIIQYARMFVSQGLSAR